MAAKLHLKVKRVYDPPGADDGIRYLVDRLWPRGQKKERLQLAAWLKDVSPSAELRRRFGHDPRRWDEFQHAFAAELDANPSAWQPILNAALHQTVTLLFGARDTEHNNAVALKSYLEIKVGRQAHPPQRGIGKKKK